MSEKPNDTTEQAIEELDGPIYTVDEATDLIAEAIDEAFDSESIWIRGEVSNFRGRNQRGHMYFSLKSDEATMPLVFFSRQNAKLDFDIDEGGELLVFGRMNVYAPHGRYQFVAEKALPAGVGALHLAFEKLKKKLSEEGLFEDEHKQDLPEFPKRIAVITSPTGAVIRDIITTSKRRYPWIDVCVFPTAVQGKEAGGQIAQAIADVVAYNDTQPVDLLIVARGGGSIEDLWCFNDERVARALFACQIPTISAIGHETDFTISDFVADVRAATPTQAAELALPDKRALQSQVAQLLKRLLYAADQSSAVAGERLKRYAGSTALRFPEKLFTDRRLGLDRLMERAESASSRLLEQLKNRVLAPSSTLKALNPLAVLGRGFALVENKSGTPLKTSGDTKLGEQVRVRFADSGLQCRVELIEGERQQKTPKPVKKEQATTSQESLF